MNPYPFASLNHFTLPLAIYYPPTDVVSSFPQPDPGKLRARVRALKNVSSPFHCVLADALSTGQQRADDGGRVGGLGDRPNTGHAHRAGGETSGEQGWRHSPQ